MVHVLTGVALVVSRCHYMWRWGVLFIHYLLMMLLLLWLLRLLLSTVLVLENAFDRCDLI